MNRHPSDSATLDTLASAETEPVFTVNGYYDGAIHGTANYQGRPHVFQCLFDEAADEYGSTFALKPISVDDLNLVLETWSLWIRFLRAFRSGLVSLSDHPVLPEDRERFEELHPREKAILQIAPPYRTLATATFYSPGRAQHEELPWRVSWRTLRPGGA